MKVEDFLNSNKLQIKEVKYKINKIKQLENDVIVYLDNKEKIKVSVDTYFKYNISELEGLDDDLYLTLKNDERLYLAYLGALRKLSIKDFTVKQIHDYLIIKKQLNNKESTEIINRLKEYKLLDDERYCNNRFNYLNKQLFSIKQIKTKLIKEGINKDLIEKYVINNVEDEYLKAKQLATKYNKTIKNKSLNAKKQAILTHIVNAGYSYDSAIKSIEDLNIESINEKDLLKKEYLKVNLKYSKKYEGYDLRNHIYSYLMNKGFNSKDIKSIMEE